MCQCTHVRDTIFDNLIMNNNSASKLLNQISTNGSYPKGVGVGVGEALSSPMITVEAHAVRI